MTLRRHSHIYHSRLQLLITFSFIVAPVLCLFLFAGLTSLTVETLLVDFSYSIMRLLTAYGIAVILAWVLALAFSTGRRSNVALPLFDVMQSFPTFALVPLAVLTFGASNTTVIFFLVITVIWPLLFSTVNALKLVKKEYWEVAEIYGLKGWKRLRYFLLPASIPGIVTGSIIGLGEGWEALVATEIIMKTEVGLGSFFERNSTEGLYTALGIILLMLMIFSINRLIWTPVLARVYDRMQE
ncbi:MAG: ABC transporter permease subunit [Candidatus Paceibacterota bacterium]